MKNKIIKIFLLIVFLIITGITYNLFNKPANKENIKPKQEVIQQKEDITTNTFSDSEKEKNKAEQNSDNETTPNEQENKSTNDIVPNSNIENESSKNEKRTESNSENKVVNGNTNITITHQNENKLSTGVVDNSESTNNNHNPSIDDTNTQDVPKEESSNIPDNSTNKPDNPTNKEDYPEIYAYSYDECFRLGEQEQIRLALESEKNLNIRFSCRQKEVNSEIRFYLYLEIYE